MSSFDDRRSTPASGPLRKGPGTPENELTAAPNPAEACSEAAARLKTVIKMLHDDYCEKLRPAGGHAARPYGERQVAEGLRDIRDLLEAAAGKEGRRRAS